LSIEAAPIVEFCLKQKVLINGVGEKNLGFLPPLNITEAEIDQVVNTFKDALVHAVNKMRNIHRV